MAVCGYGDRMWGLTQESSRHYELWSSLDRAWSPALGDTGSILCDHSGNAVDGTLTNMDPATDWIFPDDPVPFTFKKLQSLDFDGVDDYVAIPAGVTWDQTGAMSVEFWFTLDNYAPGNFPTLATFQTSLAGGIFFFLSDFGSFSGLNFGLAGSSWRASTPSAASFLDTRRHVVWTFDGVDHTAISSYKVYIDGVVDTFAGALGIGAVSNVNRIGWHASAAEQFDGEIDVVRVWGGRVLSQADITKLSTSRTIMNEPRQVYEIGTLLKP